MNADMLRQQDEIFVAATDTAVVPFPHDISACNALNATPYLISMDRFQRTFGITQRRRDLLDRLDEIVAEATELGAPLVGLLIGGSFLSKRVAAPRDLDGVYFYQSRAGGAVAPLLVALWERAKRSSIDVRFIPFDANPLVTLKVCSFFSALYARSRTSTELSRGCVLVYPSPASTSP